jgi:hypothetical protein
MENVASCRAVGRRCARRQGSRRVCKCHRSLGSLLLRSLSRDCERKLLSRLSPRCVMAYRHFFGKKEVCALGAAVTMRSVDVDR